MNFMELAQNRYSIRNFSTKAIEKDKLTKILEAGQIAPTAGNYQPQKVYVIQSEEGLEKLRTLTKCHYGASTVLIIAYDKSKDWKNPNEEGVHSGEQDASIVATHMMLPIGYAEEDARPAAWHEQSKKISEIVEYL